MRPIVPISAARCRSGRRAFTLIELLVTIGIMIFVLGVTVVGYQSMFRNVGVHSGTGRLRWGRWGAWRSPCAGYCS